jgi:hypothetical protein
MIRDKRLETPIRNPIVGKLCHDIYLLRGLVGSWLTPDRYQEGGALGYKAMGKTQIHDSSIINTINLTSCSCAQPVNLNKLESTHWYSGAPSYTCT